MAPQQGFGRPRRWSPGPPAGIALHAWEDNPMVKKAREEAFLYIRYWEVEASLRQNLWG